MVMNDLVNAELINDLVNQISSLATFLQAIGGLVIIYLVFNIINTVMNKNKKKQLEQLAKDVGEIKRILKKKK